MARSDRARPDHWTKKAKQHGFAARSVYKLEEIERRFRVIPRGGRVLDLGCAPGSWSSFARQQGADHLVGVDPQPVDGYPGEVLEASVFDVAPDRLRELLGGPADLVMSDMAPATSGNRFTDHVRQVELACGARDLALQLLAGRGHFVAKVFEGEDARGFVESLRPHFDKVKRVKPDATRKESVEFFVVALERRE